MRGLFMPPILNTKLQIYFYKKKPVRICFFEIISNYFINSVLCGRIHKYRSFSSKP